MIKIMQSVGRYGPFRDSWAQKQCTECILLSLALLAINEKKQIIYLMVTKTCHINETDTSQMYPTRITSSTEQCVICKGHVDVTDSRLSLPSNN